MKRLACLLLALVLTGLAAAPPDPPVTLVAFGLAQDYLEPCGCGGQDAGGLSRGAELLKTLRAEHPGLLVVHLGGFGVDPRRLPVITRTAAYVGVDAVGLSGDDLEVWPAIRPLAAASALPVTSLVPPEADAPARSRVISPQVGTKVGVVSAAFRQMPVGDMIEGLTGELQRLHAAGCRFSVLVSHLGANATGQVLARVPVGLRPRVVLLATSDDLTLPAYELQGATVVPVARRGRSMSIVTVAGGAKPTVAVEQRMVYKGPVDMTVQRWVNSYFNNLRAGEAQGGAGMGSKLLPVSACETCHAATVKAWRAHPHAQAVTRLERAGRDVAACLVCHSETTRREGLRPAADGDRGVVCESCHTELPKHLEAAANKPATITRETCRTCHTAENSPHWDGDAYWAHVLATCQGQIVPPPHGG